TPVPPPGPLPQTGRRRGPRLTPCSTMSSSVPSSKCAARVLRLPGAGYAQLGQRGANGPEVPDCAVHPQFWEGQSPTTRALPGLTRWAVSSPIHQRSGVSGATNGPPDALAQILALLHLAGSCAK